jgi:hypothetical protein
MEFPGNDNNRTGFGTNFRQSLNDWPRNDNTPRNKDDIKLIENMTTILTKMLKHVDDVEDKETACWYTNYQLTKDRKEFDTQKAEFEADKLEFLYSVSSDLKGTVSPNMTREMVKHVADAVCRCRGRDKGYSSR